VEAGLKDYGGFVFLVGFLLNSVAFEVDFELKVGGLTFGDYAFLP
jgi:hypothetical protein